MRTNENTIEFEGLAAVFSERDLNGDLFVPGAFTKTLKECRRPVRLLFQHQPESIIGLVKKLEETERGLRIEGYVSLHYRAGREVQPMIESRALDGLSIGYKTVNSQRDRRGRTVFEVDLWEVSVVTFPMMKRARISRFGNQDFAAIAA